MTTIPCDPRVMPCPTCGEQLTGYRLSISDPPRYFHENHCCYAPMVRMMRNFVHKITERRNEAVRASEIIQKALEDTVKMS